MREIIKSCYQHCETTLIATSDNHETWEWGIDTGNEMIRIGWGCPLDAPIRGISNGISGEMLSYINYFVPLSEFSSILAVWVVAVGAYYMASVVLRWIKAVS